MSTGVVRPAGRSADPSAITLPVSAVAARLGVAPATLRTWDRRYGLGPAGHAAGSHRRYSPRDVARLTLMQRALLSGASSADAARYALDTDNADLAALVTETYVDAASTRALLRTNTGAQARELAAAAESLDVEAMTQQLHSSIADYGVTHTWETVIRPVLGVAGTRWAGTGAGVDIEHVLSECIAATLSNVVVQARKVTRKTGPAAPVLLACMPGELHCLPLRALWAVLAERGVPVIMLGSDTPAPALVTVVQARKPSTVFLWAQMDRSADVHLLAQLPPSRYVLGGPAWGLVPLPPDMRVVGYLAEAEGVLLSRLR